MISIVIYGLIAIALAASAGYAFLTFTSSSRQLTQLQENQVRMDTAVAALRSSLLALNGNGVLFAPMGVTPTTTGAYLQLPASLGVVSTAPWNGQPYEYCPVSQTGSTNPLGAGTAGTVKYPSGGSYAVGTYSGANTQNIPYVITSSQPSNINPTNAPGYVAFIVSSLGPGQAVPDCSAIQVSAPSGNALYGSLTIPRGSVRGVTSGFAYNQRVLASIDRTEIFVGPTTSGNNSGQDENNLSSMANAIATWQSLQPRTTIIYLAGGGTYNIANDLDAEDVRPAAQGENTSLVIMTDPATASAGQANVTISQPLILTSNTTFYNVAVSQTNTASTVITAYKPLAFKNSSYTVAGSSAGVVNLYNTSLTVTNSLLSSAAITGSNSAVQFLNDTATASTFTYSNVVIGGNMMRVSFDSLPSGTTYYFNEGAGTSAPINLIGGALSVSVSSTLQTLASAPGVMLSGSAMNVSGKVVITAQAVVNGQDGGIVAIDGSNVNIASGASATMSGVGGMNNGILVRGSNLAVNGSIVSVNPGRATVGAQEATVTGTGTITVPTSAIACVQILNQAASGFNQIPIFIFASSTPQYLNYPTFAQSQYGYPALLAYGTIGSTTANALDTAAAGKLVQSATPQAFPSVNDTFVYVPASPTLPGPFYVDQPTLEADVRSFANSEYVPGLHINFGGICRSASGS